MFCNVGRVSGHVSISCSEIFLSKIYVIDEDRRVEILSDGNGVGDMRPREKKQGLSAVGVTRALEEMANSPDALHVDAHFNGKIFVI